MGVFIRKMTTEQIRERVKDWSEEMALSTDERHRKVCSDQISKYKAELERRKNNE